MKTQREIPSENTTRNISYISLRQSLLFLQHNPIWTELSSGGRTSRTNSSTRIGIVDPDSDSQLS